MHEHMFYSSCMRAHYREEPCRTALNRVIGMGFGLSLNPYMGCAHRCTFCYVRAFEQRADRPHDERYGTSIRVKTNIATVLRAELARSSWNRAPVGIGAATDPYQPAEGRYRLTRSCLEALGAADTPFTIITRGPLIVRDIDVLVAAAQRAPITVAFSVPTLNHDVWATTEPGTAPPHQRLRALTRLVDAGVRTTVAMAPMLPGLSDRPELIADVVKAARAAGACGIWAAPLNLRPGTREHFLASLARDWPELLPEYERLYANRSYLPKATAEAPRAAVHSLARFHGIRDRRRDPPRPPKQPEQLSLLEVPTR